MPQFAGNFHPGELKTYQLKRPSAAKQSIPSLLERIIRAGGKILPVESRVFRDGAAMPGWINEKIRLMTGLPNLAEFYQSFGIKLGDPYPELPGWRRCALPKHWHIKASQMEYGNRRVAVMFLDDCDTIRFGLVFADDGFQQEVISISTKAHYFLHPYDYL